LSLAAGIEAPAGNSMERDKTQAKERIAARNDFGVAENARIGRVHLGAGRSCGVMTLSCRKALRANYLTNRINPRRARKLRSPENVSNPYQRRKYRQERAYRSEFGVRRLAAAFFLSLSRNAKLTSLQPEEPEQAFLRQAGLLVQG